MYAYYCIYIYVYTPITCKSYIRTLYHIIYCTIIHRIRPEAERYGICKIVPPSQWQPTCQLDLTARNNKAFPTKLQDISTLQQVGHHFYCNLPLYNTPPYIVYTSTIQQYTVYNTLIPPLYNTHFLPLYNRVKDSMMVSNIPFMNINKWQISFMRNGSLHITRGDLSLPTPTWPGTTGR